MKNSGCAPCSKKGVLLYLFLTLNLSICFAAFDEVTEKDYLQEFPVVLSASRLMQPLADAPNAVTIIDRDMIKASGYRNTVDLFNLVPGMYVDYQDGYTPIVSYHGATDIYTRRMQVLVDGRSVYMPPFSSVGWESLPLQLDDIERIEVVRGPAATSYGANSIMGVINITTRDASAQKGADVKISKGNGGIADASARFGGGEGSLDYRLSFGYRSDNGVNLPPIPKGIYNWMDNSSHTYLANFRGNYQLNGGDSLDFQMGFSEGIQVAGYNDPSNPKILTPLRNIKTGSGYQQLNWLHPLGNGDDIQVHYYHILQSSIDERNTVPDPTGAFPRISYPISDNISAQRNELELQHTLRTSMNNRLVWVAAVRHESVDTASMFMSRQSLQETRVSLHDEWQLSKKWVFNGGAMLEDDGMGHKKTSPRAELNFHLTQEHTLRAGVSVAYRNPAMVEESSTQHYMLPNPASANPVKINGLYQEVLASGGLRPERALSREIGYLGTFEDGLSLDARIYNDQINDIIWFDYILAPGSIKTVGGFPIALDFRNEFSAQYTGFETTVKYSWGNQKRNHLTFNYTHQNVYNRFLGTPYLAAFGFGQVAMSAIQPYVSAFPHTAPTNSASVLYSGELGNGYSFSSGYYQQGSVAVLDVYDTPQPLKRRIDMRIAKQFGPSDNNKVGRGEVALVVQNVFQDTIIGYSGYTFNRRAYVTAGVNF